MDAVKRLLAALVVERAMNKLARAGKGSGYHAPHYGRPGQVGGSRPRTVRPEDVIPAGFSASDTEAVADYIIDHERGDEPPPRMRELLDAVELKGRTLSEWAAEVARAIHPHEEKDGAAKGQCYFNAGKWMMDHGSGVSGALLCHGTAVGQGPIAGLKFGHAWVEFSGGIVLDAESGKFFPKEAYYRLGHITDVVSYTYDQMLEMMMEHEDYGPWHEWAVRAGKGPGYHAPHYGRPGRVGGSSPRDKAETGLSKWQANRLAGTMRLDDDNTNREFAAQEIRRYMEVIPDDVAATSSLRQLIVCENPEDIRTWLQLMAPHEDAALEEDDVLRGFFDRETYLAAVSLWNSFDREYSGRNFFHEYAHGLEAWVTSDSWEQAWGEWEGTQDEAFADAFAEWMVGRLANDRDIPRWFSEYRPLSCALFERMGLGY